MRFICQTQSLRNRDIHNIKRNIQSNPVANINEPSGEAADIISQVADSHAIKYYNAADWQAEDNALPSLAELRDLVINQQKRVLVDFSQISDAEGQAEMQAQFRKAYGWFC